LLTARFAELTDRHIAFAALRKVKQIHDESVQIYAERLLSVAEDAYPTPGDQAVVEHQLINIFIDGLCQDYLKFNVLRDDPKTFQDAVSSAAREMSIRKRFAFRQEIPPKTKPKSRPVIPYENRDVTPMEVDHHRPKRCFKCKKTGHCAKDCRVRNVQAVQRVNLNPPQSGITSSNISREIRCWECGEMGHIRRYYPQLGFQNRQNNQGN